MNASERALQKVLAKWTATQFEIENGHVPITIDEYVTFYYRKYPKSKYVIKEVHHQVNRMRKRFTLADYYSVQLFESLAILLLRVKDNHHLEKEEGYIFERVENLDTYFIAEEYAKLFSEALSIEFKVEDIIYINECFVANGMKHFKNSVHSSYYEAIVEELIQKFSAVSNMDLSNDEKLRDGLLHHLIPMYFRIKQDIALSNPYIQEIKQQYSMLFHLTWFLMVDLEQKLNKRIPEDEVGFMMVHFQSALERNRDIKKILIVSQTGLLTSELLEMRVKKALPSIHIYETITESDLSRVDLSKVDLILTTVLLHGFDMDTPVIKLSTIPSEEELQQTAHYILEKFSVNSSSRLGMERKDTSQPLVSYLNKKQVVIDEIGASTEVIIERLVKPLELKGSVDRKYLQSVLDREKMSSTAFETGVAIPHGNPEYVNKTEISIFVSKKKISWGQEKIDVVILFSIAKEDIPHLRKIIEPIYNVIDSRSRVEQVFNGRSAEDIVNYFAKI